MPYRYSNTEIQMQIHLFKHINYNFKNAYHWLIYINLISFQYKEMNHICKVLIWNRDAKLFILH